MKMNYQLRMLSHKQNSETMVQETKIINTDKSLSLALGKELNTDDLHQSWRQTLREKNGEDSCKK